MILDTGAQEEKTPQDILNREESRIIKGDNDGKEIELSEESLTSLKNLYSGVNMTIKEYTADN